MQATDSAPIGEGPRDCPEGCGTAPICPCDMPDLLRSFANDLRRPFLGDRTPGGYDLAFAMGAVSSELDAYAESLEDADDGEGDDPAGTEPRYVSVDGDQDPDGAAGYAPTVPHPGLNGHAAPSHRADPDAGGRVQLSLMGNFRPDAAVTEILTTLGSRMAPGERVTVERTG